MKACHLIPSTSISESESESISESESHFHTDHRKSRKICLRVFVIWKLNQNFYIWKVCSVLKNISFLNICPSLSKHHLDADRKLELELELENCKVTTTAATANQFGCFHN